MPAATAREQEGHMATTTPGRLRGARGAEAHASRERRETLARGLILLAALMSFILSISLWFSGSEMEGIFVGIWVPSIISLGAFILPRRSAP
jgi:hypothetical protein